MKPLIPTLLLLFVIFSCTNSYLDGVFDRAEALMEEHPDSSLAMLKGLDLAVIDSPQKKARYALDYAMALDKNWLDTADVDAIMPALKEYRWPFKKKERFLSYYYYARILENKHSLEEAIQAFSEAERRFEKGIDSVYLIRIASAKARIYAKQFIDDKAEKALKEALQYARDLHDKENELRMLLSLADFYGATERLRQKDSLLFTLGDLPPGLELWKARSVASLVFHEPADSIRFQDDWSLFCQKAEQEPESLDRNCLVSYLLFRKRHGEALSILSHEQLENLPLEEQIAHWWLMKEAYEGLGEYKEAISAQRKYDSAVETLSFQHFQSDLRSAEERYKAQAERYRSIKRSLFLSIIILLLVGIVAWSRNQRRKMKIMLSNLREEYEVLSQLRETELAQNKYFSQKLENRLTALKPYFTDEFPDELYDSAELRRMTEDNKHMLSNVGFLFGMYHPEFIRVLEKKGLSELEIGYCCLYALGFSGKEIPDKLKRNSFYHTNSTIRQKVGLGPHDTNLSLWIQALYKDCEN